MKKTFYTLSGSKFIERLTFALISDLHGGDPSEAIGALRAERPDYILLAGDIFERLDGEGGEKYENGLTLLAEAAKIAPTFYATGNHEDGGVRSWQGKWKHTVKERLYHSRCREDIEKSGVIFLEDGFVLKNGIAFGGLMSGIINEGQEPDVSWMDRFCGVDAPKVLICHHPEYYEKYLKDRDIDLIVSGHAHGGQWRFFGRGVFAPGQGLFPKYTRGLHGGNFVISTGLKKGMIPRFFNPTEVVFIKSLDF